MGTTMTLPDFYNYTRDNRKRMADIYREVEEVQFQFNDLHARQLQEHQKLVAKYVPLMLKDPDSLPSELKQLLAAQEEVERKAIAAEIARLEKETTEKQQTTDMVVKQAQDQLAYVREQNPILNQQEEELKARRVSMQMELGRLDNELKRMGCFPIGWLTHFFARRRVQKQRDQLIENVASVNSGIRAVRQKWQEEKQKLDSSQVELQKQWQALSVETSQLQARLDNLKANTEELSKRNAAQNLLQDLRQVPVTQGPWKDNLEPVVQFGQNKAAYETGLTTVAETLGLLKGLGEGMDRFIRSVGTVYEEQRRYKLAQIKIGLSDAVTSFHALWPEFQAKVKDEKYLGTHPLEFSQRVREIVEGRLNQAAIQRMFEDMGNALNKATKAWH